MTIEGLSRRTGVSTRNIREFQSKGLLPSPLRVGRVGYYTADHVDRLQLITSMQRRGFGIDAIRELLEAHRERLGLGHVLGLGIMLTSPWVQETPSRLSREALYELIPDLVNDESLLGRAVDLGLLVADGEAFEVPSPRILKSGAELVAMGVPFGAILDEAAALQKDTARIAERFFRLAAPALKRQLKDHEPIERALEQLHPASLGAVEAFLRQAMCQAEAKALRGLASGDTDVPVKGRSARGHRR